jgi:hypothetical protein
MSLATDSFLFARNFYFSAILPGWAIFVKAKIQLNVYLFLWATTYCGMPEKGGMERSGEGKRRKEWQWAVILLVMSSSGGNLRKIANF